MKKLIQNKELLVGIIFLVVGIAYFGLAWLLAPLQATPTFDMNAMRDISLVQAIYMPLAWRILSVLRPGDKSDVSE